MKYLGLRAELIPLAPLLLSRIVRSLSRPPSANVFRMTLVVSVDRRADPTRAAASREAS